MAQKRGLRGDHAALDSMMAAGGAILAICLLVVAGIAIAGELDGGSESASVAKKGSLVKVDYVGTFSDGRVFDTSLASVGEDGSRAKSFEFNARDTSSYTPLSFTIGDRRMLPGFEDAVIGLRVGESRVFTLRAADAYGEVPADSMSVHDLLQSIDAVEVISASGFTALYGESPAQGLSLKHPLYGWDVTVLLLDSDGVTLRHLPLQGGVYNAFGDPSDPDPHGWQLRVNDVADGVIEFEHLLTASMVNTVRGTDAEGSFYLMALDGGSYTIKRASETVGMDLTFEVTLVSITA